MSFRILTIILVVVMGLGWAGDSEAGKKKKKKKKQENITKIISKTKFTEATLALAEDERVPFASSTLVEKGRGKGFYSPDKLIDDDPETFWAEGAKGTGKNEFIAVYLPDGTTHVEITPGAGKEQFKNFNRPKQIYLDVYRVTLTRKDEKYTSKFKYLGRTVFNFKNEPKTVRKKLSVKLPEVATATRSMYVGAVIIQKVYKGQFDDTSISNLKTSIIWGEQ